MIGIVNADMFGTPAEVGEHIDWSEPDVLPAVDWGHLLGMPVEEYATWAPHMIVFEVA